MRKTQNLTLTKTATGTKKTNGYTLICHIIAHQLGWGRHCLKAKEKALMGQTFWLDAETIAYKPFIYTALCFNGFCGSWSSGLFVVSLVPAQGFRLTSQKLIRKNKNTNTNAKFFQICRDIKKKYQWMGSRFLAVCLCRLCISSYSPECVARMDPNLGIDHPPQNHNFLPSLHHHHHPHHHHHYHHYHHHYHYYYHYYHHYL